MKKNVVLIGMPGAGKSTIGVVLAKRLGYKFLDSDLVIQEKEGKLLHELITEHGIEGFWKIENDVNESLDVTSCVIATGGSAIYGEGAMKHLSEIGTIIYLSIPEEELEQRLGDLNARGVTLKPGQTLSSLFEERRPLYEKYADIVIDCSDSTIWKLASEIERIILAKS